MVGLPPPQPVRMEAANKETGKMHLILFIFESSTCSDEHIKNIILSDVFYLTRIKTDVQKLLIELHDKGISTDDLTDLIQNYPYILEKDDFEISEFFNKKMGEGATQEEVCEMILSNPHVLEL